MAKKKKSVKKKPVESQATVDYDKTEARTGGERTLPGKFYAPATDIYETGDALVIVMDMPGVSKERVDVQLENNVLRVEGHIDFNNYRGLDPVYTEYNVGHFTRKFDVSPQVDQERITARIAEGVLTVNLPKVPEARTRRIRVT